MAAKRMGALHPEHEEVGMRASPSLPHERSMLQMFLPRHLLTTLWTVAFGVTAPAGVTNGPGQDPVMLGPKYTYVRP